jgi:guanidinopropionase
VNVPIYESLVNDRALHEIEACSRRIAPAVSNPEPGEEGLTMKEAIRILQGMRGMDVIGADVVELMPSLDGPNPMTAQNATRLAFELICPIADGLAGEPDHPATR